jgi:poly(3-hydroxybutyrate) depolymerase
MTTRLFTVALLACMLSACGGSSDNNGSSAATTAPARGSLIQSPPARIASVTASDLFATLTSSTQGQQVLALISAPKCGIDVHQLRYNTVDATGQPTTASGALMIPTGSDPACQGPRPIAVYAHGTQVERTFNIADLTNSGNAEGLLMAAVFSAQGYILVAPNYAGFDTSTLPYHPYLNGDQQSKDTADSLTAARSSLPTSFAPNVTDSGKLFITGYSQGGYVAMATHRLLQQSGATVTASAPMSGPYAMAAFGDAIFYGNVIGGAPLFVTYVATGYQRAYANIYTTPTDLFEARYATGIDMLLPTSGSRSEIFSQGKLPREQLFSNIPPDPSLAPFTPPTGGELAPVFARGFGPENLITNPARLTYVQDAQAHPDGGFPNTTDGAPAASPANPLRQALKTNDMRNWLPGAPVLLCAGDKDPTVLYMNTQLIQGYWASRAAPGPIKVLDLDSLSLGDPDAGLKLGFAAAKQAVAAAAVAAGATDGGFAAVAEAYHSQLVPPFCLAAVRSFFNGL